MKRLIVIGASAGGVNALRGLLGAMGDQIKVPVVICKHLAPGDEKGVVTVLKYSSAVDVELAEDKQPLKAGTVYVAPGNYHLQIERRGWLSLSIDERVCHCRPAIDVLFETAANAYKKDVVAIVLTGANEDGAEGVRAVKAHGGTVIVQASDEAEVSIMPLAAIATGCADYILKLEDIARYLKLL